MNTDEKIEALRELMRERHIDVYYVPNEDDHLSEEYTADAFKAKSWLSGFTGDAGCVIVTKDFAGLWTDGRYFTQAEKELAGTQVTLMRMRQEGVPTAEAFLIQNTPENGVLGFDGHVVSAGQGRNLSAALAAKHASLRQDEDLVGMLWKDRPAMPDQPVFVLEDKYAGKNVKEKIAEVRAEMKLRRCDLLILTAVEDPCWLLNVRGNDIPCTPVPYAWCTVSDEEAVYYIGENQVNEEVKKYLQDAGVTVKGYDEIYTDLKQVSHARIWCDLNKLNMSLYECLCVGEDNHIYPAASPIVMHRSVKNETEIRNTWEAHILDGIAMVRFIKWVKEHRSDADMSELKAQNKLYALRAEGKDYIEPSFDTIAAYGPNAAMMHYTATEENYAMCEPHGFLLVDSGGTYKLGSTDITRTIAMGPLTDEEKKAYTLVLKGHLDLANAVFLYGTNGNNLDILARRPLWNHHIDYQCGTGHGVGYALSVHEGPQAIRWGVPSAARPSAVFEAGMVVTDEPGIYIPDVMGIRIENELLVKKEEKNFYGQWLSFDSLTFCPYEPEAIDPRYLDEDNVKQINAYHQKVYETLSPYLNEEEKAWLKEETREIVK